MTIDTAEVTLLDETWGTDHDIEEYLHKRIRSFIPSLSLAYFPKKASLTKVLRSFVSRTAIPIRWSMQRSPLVRVPLFN